MSKVIIELGNEYQNHNIKNADCLFRKSGECFEKLCEMFIKYLLDEKNDIKVSRDILLNIVDLEYHAYELINKGIKVI